jgi:site-specific DNA recombinase
VDGGVVPLGYNCVDRQLIVNAREAATVREIFRQYIRLGCVRKLKQVLARKQIFSKARANKDGKKPRGRVFARGALYHLLKNPLYIGRIQHRKEIYEGQHKPIVPVELWEQAARRLRKNNERRRERSTRSSASLLGGKLFDGRGMRLTPTHSVKKSKRYRYYTSQAIIENVTNRSNVARLPAYELEQLVRQQVHNCLGAPKKCATAIKNEEIRERFVAACRQLCNGWTGSGISEQDDFIGSVLRKVTVRRTSVVVEIDKAQLVASVVDHKLEASRLLFSKSSKFLSLTSPFQIHRRGNEVRIITPPSGAMSTYAPIASLVKLIARARDWYEEIVSGRAGAVEQIAEDSHLTNRYVRKILGCAVLSPEITEAILTGQHRRTMILSDLSRIPLDWRRQKSALTLSK